MPERPDEDSPERYPLLGKWYPNRPHRGGPGGGDMDFMAAESLYRPSALGRASVQPGSVAAGGEERLELTFEAGPGGLPTGATVRFCMRGQVPLGCRFQSKSRGVRGYMQGSGPEHCEIRTSGLSFTVSDGELREGDRVTLTTPEPFVWTPLAGRRALKVCVRMGNDCAEQRVPEPLVIDITPGAPHHLEATIPCTRKGDGSVRVHVTMRDEFDNRVLRDGHVDVRTDDHHAAPCMTGGLATCPVTLAGDDAARIAATEESSGLSCRSNPCIATDDLHLYVGDLHCHDFLSEAEGYTDQVYRWAIEDRALDFVSVSAQAHGWLDNETWTVVKYMNERYLDEGRFVTLLGFEWQHSGFGDKVVHFLGGDHPFLCKFDKRYNTPARLYEALRGCDATVISHHPSHKVPKWCPGTDFDTVEDDVERVVELWSMHGSSEGYDPDDRPLRDAAPDNWTVMKALRKGLRLGFVAGSDTHSARPGGSAKEPGPHWGGLAAVWAESLTRRSLFAAIRERRTYALTGARIVLRMTVNGALMGSELPASDTAEVQIDVWPTSRIEKVEIVKNTELLQTLGPFDGECHLELTDKTSGPAFYHCRVTQDDGHLAVCSPVWIG